MHSALKALQLSISVYNMLDIYIYWHCLDFANNMRNCCSCVLGNLVFSMSSFRICFACILFVIFKSLLTLRFICCD